VNPPKLPPTFRDSSPIANGLAVRRDPIAFFKKLSAEAGDIAHFVQKDAVIYLIQDPALIREILASSEDEFAKWSARKGTLTVFGRGLLASEGNRHRRMRRAVSPAFHQTQLTKFAGKITEVADRYEERWPKNERFNFAHALALLALDVVVEALFHSKLNGRGEAIVRANDTMERLEVRFGTSARDDALMIEASSTVDAIMSDLLDERAASLNGENDLLSLMISAIEEEESQAKRAELVQEARTFLLAGHVTTATSVAATLWLLATHPQTQSQVQSEIDLIVGGRAPRFADIPKLSVVENVFLEALRLYPPVWIMGRRALRDFQFGEYCFPIDSTITICPWLIHRDGRYFQRPEEFRPERWENNARSKLPRIVYLPFSAGTRGCIGERFAMMEAILLLTKFMQRWTFEPVPDRPVTWTPLVTLCALNGVWLRAIPRS
jgi:cytochrome P450